MNERTFEKRRKKKSERVNFVCTKISCFPPSNSSITDFPTCNIQIKFFSISQFTEEKKSIEEWKSTKKKGVTWFDVTELNTTLCISLLLFDLNWVTDYLIDLDGPLLFDFKFDGVTSTLPDEI